MWKFDCKPSIPLTDGNVLVVGEIDGLSSHLTMYGVLEVTVDEAFWLVSPRSHASVVASTDGGGI
jgi:hypothetical protein